MLQITNYQKAKELIAGLDADRQGMDANAAYLSGDHWQRGKGWGGPPIPDDMFGGDETSSQAREDHTPIPVIAEIVNRFAVGLVGREPAFEVVLSRELEEDEEPTPEEVSDLARLNVALGNFYDDADGQSAVYDFVVNLCSGRGTLRFFIPPERELPAKSTFEDVFKHFYLEAPGWEYCGVVVDKLTMRQYGVYLYEADNDSSLINAENNTRTFQRAEVTQIDDNGTTLFQVLDGGETQMAAHYDCNGNIWIYQATLKQPLIREPQRKLQRCIDFLNTILPKNAQYAGYRERHFMNVQKTIDPETGQEVDPVLGPTTVNFWQSSTYVDADGNVKPAAATLVMGEPVDSSPIRADIAHMAQMLLRSCYQEHVVISGDSTASAVSRVQARAEFADSLLQVKPKVEKALRDLFMTVLCLACQLSGESALLQRLKTNYRMRVDVKPNAGPLAPDEQRVIVQLYNERVISLETAQTLLGIEDVDGEGQKLLAEQSASQEYLLNQATIAQTLAAAGAGIKAAAEVAGFDDEQTEVLGKTDFEDGDIDGRQEE